jgi:hypothetical protein
MLGYAIEDASSKFQLIYNLRKKLAYIQKNFWVFSFWHKRISPVKNWHIGMLGYAVGMLWQFRTDTTGKKS